MLVRGNLKAGVETPDWYENHATEGKAHLVLGNAKLACHYYECALKELDKSQGKMAESSYKQVCRLWKAFGDELVGPVLEAFESSAFRKDLPKKFLQRPFTGRLS